MRGTNTRLTLTLVFLTASLGCARLPEVKHASEIEDGSEFVFYSLPRAIAVARLEGRIVTVSEDAPCRTRAADIRALGLKIKKPGRYFGLSSVSLEARTEPDPKHWYGVNLKSPSVATVGVTLSPDGTLASAEAEAYSSTAESIGSALRVAGQIAGGVLFGSATAPDLVDDFCSDQVAIIEKSRRDQGLLLTAGALPHEAKALELKLAQLELIEARATAHFTGTDLGPTEEILCEVVFPRKGGSVELLTYRHSEGVLSASSRCEMPADLFAEAAPENGALASDASQEHSVTLNWRLVEGLGAIPKKLAKTRKTGDTQSFAYRMPAAADVWLTDGGEPLTQRERWWIPQLGEVFRLTRMKSGGKSQVALEFDPETGALLAIQSQSAGPNVGALAGGAGEGWAAIEEARSRRAASDPELARALRDEQYFEALANVRAARAILEEAPLEQPSPSQETEPAAPLAPAPTEPTAPQP